MGSGEMSPRHNDNGRDAYHWSLSPPGSSWGSCTLPEREKDVHHTCVTQEGHVIKCMRVRKREIVWVVFLTALPSGLSSCPIILQPFH